VSRSPAKATFADVSKIDHAPIAEKGHTRMVALQVNMLSREEFASLLMVGNTRAMSDPPAIIPADHRIMLIALGYMATWREGFE
jgi:hypothetical protein